MFVESPVQLVGASLQRCQSRANAWQTYTHHAMMLSFQDSCRDPIRGARQHLSELLLRHPSDAAAVYSSHFYPLDS